MLIYRKLQAITSIILCLLSSTWFSALAQSPEHRNTLVLAKPPPTQSAAPADDHEIRRNEFAVWSGGSFITAGISGTIKEVKFGIVGVRYARVLASGKIAVFKWTVDAIPFATMSYLKKEALQTATGVITQRTHPTVAAVGTAPIGLQVNFRPQHRLQPFANLSGGCLYFANLVPNQAGKQFNFTAELGIGAQILTSSHQAISLGYKLHHISNAGRGAVNPGFGSNLFYVGFSLFK